MAQSAPSPSHRLNLPLFHFLADDAILEGSASGTIRQWRRIWCPAQLHLAESGWEADQFNGSRLGRFLAERHKQPLWPQVALGDENTKTSTKDLTTGVLLEAEAWTNAYHFMRVFFPDDVVPVFNELVGWIDFESAGFGMALVHDHVDCLVPLVTDLCMQQPCFLTKGELTHQVPGLRVLWNPPTTLPDGSLFISLWGDRFLSPEESGGLEVQRLQLWAAREIAMRSGGIICPMCMIGLGQSACSGDCFFARECRDSFGIDPVTGRPSTQPRDGGTQNE